MVYSGSHVVFFPFNILSYTHLCLLNHILCDLTSHFSYITGMQLLKLRNLNTDNTFKKIYSTVHLSNSVIYPSTFFIVLLSSSTGSNPGSCIPFGYHVSIFLIYHSYSTCLLWHWHFWSMHCPSMMLILFTWYRCCPFLWYIAMITTTFSSYS